MNIKVGDKVRVKSWNTLWRQNKEKCLQGIIMNNSCIIFNIKMRIYCGRLYEVDYRNGNNYHLMNSKNEEIKWNFTGDMLEKVGDKDGQ